MTRKSIEPIGDNPRMDCPGTRRETLAELDRLKKEKVKEELTQQMIRDQTKREQQLREEQEQDRLVADQDLLVAEELRKIEKEKAAAKKKENA